MNLMFQVLFEITKNSGSGNKELDFSTQLGF